MFEVFTTREVSIGIYMVIIAIIVWFKCRREVLNVLQCLFNIQLVIPFMILLVYVSIIIYCSTRMFFLELDIFKRNIDVVHICWCSILFQCST